MVENDRQLTIDRIFREAIELEEEDQQEHLDRSCADLPSDVRPQIERLLRADQRLSNRKRPFLEVCPANASSTVPTTNEDESLVGNSIGQYKIERRIGGGGFGVVYLAKRKDDFQQQVAIKLSHPHREARQVTLRRFEFERQVLSDLRHPNIARLLDGGSTDDGRPFFVMEYVDGLPITEHCDVNQFTITERLKLFQKVCFAVAHAHQYSVIHRDLKPANILIDAEGEPKLLDFGIAKIVDDDGLRASESITVTGQLILTPEYASPEQINGTAVGTPSDVYTLGVLLYELLTGVRPFEFPNRSTYEVARVINEQIPKRPSTAIRVAAKQDAGDEAQSTLQASDADTRSLRKVLMGDLDNIILKALTKEPQRRYGSAQDFGQDIQRFFDGMPVLAGRISPTYRLAKFVRRNKTLVGVVLIAAVLLILATINALFSWRASIDSEKKATLGQYHSDLALATRELSDGNYDATESILRTYRPSIFEKNINRWPWYFLSAEILREHKGWTPIEVNQRTQIQRFDGKRYLRTLLGGTRFVEIDIANGEARELLQIQPKAFFYELSSNHRYMAAGWHNEDPNKDAKPENGVELQDFATSGRIEITDLETMQLARTIEFQGEVHAFAFSSSGKYIAGVENGKRITVWETSSGDVVQTIQLAPDEGRVISLTDKHIANFQRFEKEKENITVWEIVSGKKIHSERYPDLDWARFQQNSETLVLSARRLQIWRLADGKITKSNFARGLDCFGVSFSPSEKLAAIKVPREIQIWDVASETRIARKPIPQNLDVYVDFYDSEDKLLIWTDTLSMPTRKLQTWNFVEKDTSSPTKNWRIGWNDSLAISADTKHVGFGRPDKRLNVWNSRTNENHVLGLPPKDRIHVAKGDPRGSSADVSTVAFSNGKNLVAFGDGLGNIEIRDYVDESLKMHVNHRSTLTQSVNTHVVTRLAFSPDNKTLISGGIGQLSGWDVATGERIWNEPLPDDVPNSNRGYAQTLAFFSDDLLFVGGGRWRTPGHLTLWKISSSSAQKINQIEHETIIVSMALSPDKRHLVTGDPSGVTVYDLSKSPKNPKPMFTFEHRAMTIAFSPDSSTLILGCLDKWIYMIDIASQRLLTRVYRENGVKSIRVFEAEDKRIGFLTGQHTSTPKRGDISLEWIDHAEIDAYWQTKK